MRGLDINGHVVDILTNGRLLLVDWTWLDMGHIIGRLLLRITRRPTSTSSAETVIIPPTRPARANVLTVDKTMSACPHIFHCQFGTLLDF